MTVKEFHSYSNPKFERLLVPMRQVMSAYGEATQFFANLKELTWYRYGLKHTTKRIHKLEHIQPERIDEFKNILAQHHLPLEYPPIKELDTESLQSLQEIFELCVEIIDKTDEALENFIVVCSENKFGALARQVEQLQIDNSKDRQWLLEAWAMIDNDTSLSSFDNWIKGI